MIVSRISPNSVLRSQKLPVLNISQCRSGSLFKEPSQSKCARNRNKLLGIPDSRFLPRLLVYREKESRSIMSERQKVSVDQLEEDDEFEEFDQVSVDCFATGFQL